MVCSNYRWWVTANIGLFTGLWVLLSVAKRFRVCQLSVFASSGISQPIMTHNTRFRKYLLTPSNYHSSTHLTPHPPINNNLLKQLRSLQDKRKEEFVNSCQCHTAKELEGGEIFKSNHWDFHLIDIVLKINYVVYVNSAKGEEKTFSSSEFSYLLFETPVAGGVLFHAKARFSIIWEHNNEGNKKPRRKKQKNRFSTNVKGHVWVGGLWKISFHPKMMKCGNKFPFRSAVTECRLCWVEVMIIHVFVPASPRKHTTTREKNYEQGKFPWQASSPFAFCFSFLRWKF